MSKTVEEMVSDVASEIKSFKDNTGAAVAEQKAKVAELEAKLAELANVANKEDISALQSQFDELATKFSEGDSKIQGKKLNFAQSFAKSLDDNKQALADASGIKRASKGGKMDMGLELKDMDYTNFGTGAYEAATERILPGVYVSPFTPLWLRNIFPNGSTTGGTIKYLRANGATGAAAVWDPTISPRASKPEVDFDFELVTENVVWIAGITRVPREMLEDTDFLSTYIPNRLVYGPEGILVAENDYIYDILTDPANSTAYDGTQTEPVKVIYDAALGQIRDNYFAATAILMNNRDFVNLIALNQSTGATQVFDLPPGTVAVINGQWTIGGIPIYGLPQIPAGTFVVVDGNATQFVNRMSPEVRAFEEDRDNVIKNLITFRAEERGAFLVFDAGAVITGTFGS